MSLYVVNQQIHFFFLFVFFILSLSLYLRHSRSSFILFPFYFLYCYPGETETSPEVRRSFPCTSTVIFFSTLFTLSTNASIINTSYPYFSTYSHESTLLFFFSLPNSFPFQSNFKFFFFFSFIFNT